MYPNEVPIESGRFFANLKDLEPTDFSQKLTPENNRMRIP
jgi:hypothetical protein